MPAPPAEAMPKALKPAPTKKLRHLGRLADHPIAIRREALEAIDHLLDPGRGQRRNAPQRQTHDRLEMIQSSDKRRKAKSSGTPRRTREWGSAHIRHDEAADFLLVIGEAIRIAQRRQTGVTPAMHSVTIYW